MGKKKPAAAKAVTSKAPKEKRQVTERSFPIAYVDYLIEHLCEPAVEGQPLTLK